MNLDEYVKLFIEFLETKDLEVCSSCDDPRCEYGGHYHDVGGGHKTDSDITDWQAAFADFVKEVK